MTRLIGTFAIALAAFVVTPAQAQDSGDVSSGAMNITVVIAPFGAAIAAAQEGAVGAWSVSGTNDGVMVSAPETLDATRVREFSIFNNADVPVSVTSSSQIDVVRGEQRNFKGLSRQNFSLRLADSATAEPVSVVVASL